MLVCHCCKVTDKQIADAVANGARTLEEITLATGAGSDCGGCIETLIAHLAQLPEAPALSPGQSRFESEGAH